MTTVLFIKANNRLAEQAISVKLYESFLESYKAAHPEDNVVELDLFAENLPYYNADMINGGYKASQGYELTAAEQEAHNVQVKYLDQFMAADKVVFGFPLWNGTVPAVLHTYMDYLCVAGRTFKYTAEGPVGLAGDKKVALLNARGGDFSSAEANAREMAVNLMTQTLQLFGVNDITKVIVEGHNQYPDQSATLIANGVEAAAKAAVQF